MKRSFSIFTMFLVAGASVAMAQAPEQKNNDKEARTSDGCGFLGVYPTNVSSEESTELKLPSRLGAIVEGVVDGTPAEATGIQEKDVIIGWNGEKVNAEPQFRKMVMGTKPGSTVKVDLFRNGQPMSLTVQALGSRADCGGPAIRMVDPRLGQELGNADREIREAERRIEIAERRVRESINLPGFMLVTEQGRLGATVQNLSPQLGKYFGLDGSAGALVSSVAENSSGARGGLLAGDVILSVDGTKIADPRSFAELLRTKAGKVNITVLRDRRETTLTVDLGALPNAPKAPTAPQQPKAPAVPELGSSLFYEGSTTPALGNLYFESETK